MTPEDIKEIANNINDMYWKAHYQGGCLAADDLYFVLEILEPCIKYLGEFLKLNSNNNPPGLLIKFDRMLRLRMKINDYLHKKNS